MGISYTGAITLPSGGFKVGKLVTVFTAPRYYRLWTDSVNWYPSGLTTYQHYNLIVEIEYHDTTDASGSRITSFNDHTGSSAVTGNVANIFDGLTDFETYADFHTVSGEAYVTSDMGENNETFIRSIRIVNHMNYGGNYIFQTFKFQASMDNSTWYDVGGDGSGLYHTQDLNPANGTNASNQPSQLADWQEFTNIPKMGFDTNNNFTG